MPPAPNSRFLTLDDVAEELNTSQNQIYALVRQGKLAAIKIGGRGQWRVGRDDLEQYIERAYDETRQFIKDNPYQAAESETAWPNSPDEVSELAAMSNPLPPRAAVTGTGTTDAVSPGNSGQLDSAEPEL
ncbi:DNA-binding protein [Kribbella capetownensis]|uniref:DNA-binding protein n=1 Tax=Kribbella capetownensis TaxID=1572659 RepID=A0A4R0IK77_9ACTN|nr:DNA-binding protein [Kribbella capetownensis]